MQASGLWGLTLIGNDAMTSLSNAGTIVPPTLELRDNRMLTSLAGIGLGNVLSVINNDALVTLNGLAINPNGTTQTLNLEDNAALTSLSGLSNLSSVTSTLSIENNPALPQCAALAFSARITGTSTRTIAGNNTTATCP
jgi:hypothetical protein